MKHLICSLSLFFILLLGHPLKASEMHVLLAMGSSSSPQIQKAIDLDLKYMKEALFELKNKLHIEVNIKELTGKMLTDSNIHEWLKTLSAKPDDLALMYYSGNGISVDSSDDEPSSDTSRQAWPSCDLPGSDEIVDLEIYIDELYDINCKFRLLIADCCTFKNSSSKFTKRPPQSYWKKKALNLENTGYQILFLESHGMIATSAQVMDSSAWVSPKGSLFTETFLEHLHREVQLPRPDWHHLFEKTFEAYDKMQKNKYQYSLQEVEYKSPVN
jgi:hypothetical protein